MIRVMNVRHHLVLASQSPRRSELLKNAGYEFAILPTQISEIPNENLNLPEQIRDLACQKADACASSGKVSKGQRNLILASDTVVILDGQILGKPVDQSENKQYLRRLSGRVHSVISAICLLDFDQGKRAVDHETSFITFKQLSDAEIDAYVATSDGLDKAGGYGIQSPLAKDFVSNVEGPYDNIVGLPVDLVKRMLNENGWNP